MVRNVEEKYPTERTKCGSANDNIAIGCEGKDG